MECLAGLDQSMCEKALGVVLATVASSGWTPTRVWINGGSLAPIEGLLFNPNANFPAPNIPEGASPAGNAEVAFAETDKHAGINLTKVGSEIVADLVGYVVPHAAWCSGYCPSALSTEGPFHLEIVLPRTEWSAGEPILGSAILSFDGSAMTTIYGAGTGVINFAYAEVGGTRKVDPVWEASCGAHQLELATPINEQLSKSGAIPNDGPDADFVRSFLTGPDVRLPLGAWDITAVALFFESEDCGGSQHSIRATMRVTVGGSASFLSAAAVSEQ